MRELDLRRHTDNDGDVLSEEGVAAALELGRRIDPGFVVAVSSGAQRATQTIACILAGRGHTPGRGVVVAEDVRSDREDEWRAAYEEAGGGHLDDFRRVAPELVRDEAERLGSALGRILRGLDEGDRALVVGHSPTNEAAVMGLTGVVIDPMDKGGGVRVREDDGGYTVTALD